MSFANTSHINLNVLLSSQFRAQNFIQRFIDEHKKDTSSFSSAVRKMLFSSNFNRQYQGLAQLYQAIIIPTLNREIEEAAKKEVEQEWKRQGKQIYCQKTLFNGKVMNNTTNLFDLAVQRRVEEKKKNKEYQRRVKEQTRLSSADGILKGAKVESDVPSGFEMGDGNNDDYSPPNPSPNPNERPCKTCPTMIKGKGDQCLACFRKWFIENRLKKIVGWNKLTSEEQEYYCEKVDQCKKSNEFRALKQEVINAIQNKGDDDDEPNNPIHKIFLVAWDHDSKLQKLIAKYGLSNNKNWFLSIVNETFLKADRTINYDELEKFFQQNVSSKTCSECSKKFYGTCLTIGKGKSELFCSEGCAKTWQKKDPNDDSGEEIIEDDGNDLPINDPPVENNLLGENNTQLPSNIQSIASLPFPQAQIVAEQKIKKLLKDNNISKQELIQLAKTVFSGKGSWEDYLKSLNTPAEVAQFVNKMQQAILEMRLTNKTPNKDKNPKNDWILPVAILVVSILALTSLVLIVRKRRRMWG